MTLKIKKFFSPQEERNNAPGSFQAENTNLRKNTYRLEKEKLVYLPCLLVLVVWYAAQFLKKLIKQSAFGLQYLFFFLSVRFFCAYKWNGYLQWLPRKANTGIFEN